MIGQLLQIPTHYSVQARLRSANFTWLAWFAGVMLAALALSLSLIRSGPDLAVFAWLVYFLGCAAILYRPRYAIYLILFFGLVGDAVLIPWYPFNKNFSSPESIFFLHDAIIISPLETYILLGYLSWLVRLAFIPRLKILRGPLFAPALAFLGFVLLGLGYGLLTGGNLNIALWESRPLFYLVAMLLLTTNLLEKREQISNLIWTVMLALFIEALVGLWYFLVVLRASLAGVEAITEHAAAIHMNTFFIFSIAIWLYKAAPAKKLLIPVMIPVVVFTFLATQRRAAFVSLAVAFLLLAIVLFLENRRLFWRIVPLAALLSLVYLAAFWNSGSTLGLPAQSIKSIIAPEKLNAADWSSNYYRFLENINVDFSIHERPLTGVGFGQKFLIIVPMPDISWFTWWNYLPHNSVFWIWLKMGVGGFLITLFLIGFSILVGAAAFWRMPRNELRAIALVCVVYVVMHFTYAYVDISWDTQSMLYLGAVLGIINSLERVASQPLKTLPARWPWQKAPPPEAEILPLPQYFSS